MKKLQEHIRFLNYCLGICPEEYKPLFKNSIARCEATLDKYVNKLKRKKPTKKLKGFSRWKACLMIDWLESNDVISESRVGRNFINQTKEGVSIRIGNLMSYEEVRAQLEASQMPLTPHIIAEINQANKITQDAIAQLKTDNYKFGAIWVQKLKDQAAHRKAHPYAYDLGGIRKIQG